jgi:uncharacterized membrane protein YwzB
MQTLIKLLMGILFFIAMFWGLASIYFAAMAESASLMQWALGIGLLAGAIVIYGIWFKPK